MTRSAILSFVRLVGVGSLGALGATSLLGCSGSSQSGAAGTGGLRGIGGDSTTSASAGGVTALTTTTADGLAGGNAFGGAASGSGGANSASGGASTQASTTRVNASGGATSASGLGGAGITGGNQATATGGTHANGSGGMPTTTGATHTTGGTHATGGATAAAAGGTQSASSGGSGSTATGGATAAPSTGCTSTAAPASGRFSIDVGGTAREYIIKLPDTYDSKHPYRLIFAFHGRQYSAESVASGGPPGSGPYYGIESEAKGSAIFVAPQALASSWNTESDLAFVTAMVNRFESELCIDENRIFSTGFSMGAIMTIAIGCSQASVFRAIAPMSGSVQGTCGGSQPIAYWASHGTNDTTIPIANGEAARDVFVTRNGCNKTGTTPGTPAGCVNYTGCDEGYPTTWCTFDGVHEPPPFAGQAIWAFFAQF